MTSDEIQALSGQKLDAAIGQAMDWSQAYDGYWPNCHDSLDHCHEAEERLKEMGLATAFTVQLYLVAVEAQKADGRRHPIRWYEVHAPARDRAEAILAAMQEA